MSLCYSSPPDTEIIDIIIDILRKEPNRQIQFFINNIVKCRNYNIKEYSTSALKSPELCSHCKERVCPI